MSKILTAEEFFRSKMKEKYQLPNDFSLSRIEVSSELAMRWAKEYADEHTKQNIEALLIEIRKKDGWIISKEELTVIFNQFLENIN